MTRLVHRLLQRYWRLSRGLTMGAQAVVVDGDGCVLLVRHGYRPGWHLPGGGVDFNETLMAALLRELDEETGIVPTSTPELHGVFANFEVFPGDHVAVFIVRRWRRPRVPEPTVEIREQRFFFLHELPDDVAPGARRRLAEVLEGASRGETW